MNQRSLSLWRKNSVRDKKDIREQKQRAQRVRICENQTSDFLRSKRANRKEKRKKSERSVSSVGD